MSNLDNTGTNLTGLYTLDKRTGTVIKFDTDNKYVAKDIWFTVEAQSASPTFKGGAVSGTASIDTATNCSISSSTNNSGASFEAQGSATRAKIQYNNAVNGWVEAAANADAYAAGTATALTPTTYYINGVTISTTKNFNITIPNGTTTPNLTLNFAVDSNGNVIVT